LTAALVDQLRADGFAVASGVVSDPLLTRLRAEAEGLVTRFTDVGHRSDDYWFFVRTGSRQPVLYRVHNLERQGSDLISGLYAGGPLHMLATNVLGGSVQSTACAMIVKMPRLAAAVPWHRDRTSVPPFTAYNLSLFLDDSVPENGCLEFVPGSHLLADEADVTATHEGGPVNAVPVTAGDVVVHDVSVVHSSRPNGSPAWRRSIVVEFAPAGFVLTHRDG
jgi:hypothetical protein